MIFYLLIGCLLPSDTNIFSIYFIKHFFCEISDDDISTLDVQYQNIRIIIFIQSYQCIEIDNYRKSFNYNVTDTMNYGIKIKAMSKKSLSIVEFNEKGTQNVFIPNTINYLLTKAVVDLYCFMMTAVICNRSIIISVHYSITAPLKTAYEVTVQGTVALATPVNGAHRPRRER